MDGHTACRLVFKSRGGGSGQHPPTEGPLKARKSKVIPPWGLTGPIKWEILNVVDIIFSNGQGFQSVPYLWRRMRKRWNELNDQLPPLIPLSER